MFRKQAQGGEPPSVLATDSLPAFVVTTVDGIPALWCDLDGEPFASLLFGSGIANEALHERGAHHLIEHLALGWTDLTSSSAGVVVGGGWGRERGDRSSMIDEGFGSR